MTEQSVWHDIEGSRCGLESVEDESFPLLFEIAEEGKVTACERALILEPRRVRRRGSTGPALQA
jgi:hypothetical protein